MRIRAAAPLALVLVAAACGASEPSVYKPTGTADCLRGDDYRVTTDVSKVGVVAASASLGALRAFEPGNTLTISFGSGPVEAAAIVRGYRRFAPKRLKRHLDDVLRTEKNAVLLWTITPSAEKLDAVLGCLKG